MSTFTDIYNNIQSVVNRPDLQTFIQSRINAGIRLLSATGQFSDDLVELTLGAAEAISPTAYTQLYTLPADFRSVAYLDYSVITGGVDETSFKPLELLNTNELGHRDSRFKSNLYYTAGNKLHIKHDSLTPSFIFGYFATPATLSGVQTNWITNRVPELLEETVIGAIRVILGDNEAAAYLTRLNQFELAIQMQDILQKGPTTSYSGRS